MNFLETGMGALKESFKAHKSLGSKGRKKVSRNRFGDMSLKMDIDIERAVFNFLKRRKAPLRIISEEHGIVNITKKPRYLAVIDGLDGSKVYLKGKKERYGTMLGIFSNINPKYQDYVFSGVMEHPTERLFYGLRGKGSFLLKNNKSMPINCSKTIKLTNKTRIYLDQYPANKKLFCKRIKGLNVHSLGSSAACYVDLASGKADLVLECTRKSNLEIAATYGLISEAGGFMVDIDGNTLGLKKHLRFGQSDNIPVISSATKQLLRRFLAYIHE